MKFFKHHVLPALIAGFFIVHHATAQATPIADINSDPFNYFNVYSLKDITYHNNDFQGSTGAAGDFDVIDFTLFNLDANEYALLAGGSVSYKQGSIGYANWGIGGSVGADGNVHLGNFSMYDGDIHSAGNLDDSLSGGGTINGHVYAAGTIDTTVSFITDGLHPETPYLAIADHDSISQYFLDYSAAIGDMEDTGDIMNTWGALTINAGSGVNVYSIDALNLLNAYSVTINGPDDAIVYINVEGTTPTLNNTNWYYNGVPRDNVLLNYYQATSLTYTNSNTVNLLAPLANTTYNNGQHNGNLIVGNLSGSGQVNLGHFAPPAFEDTPSPVPEPATMLLFGTGLIGIAARVRRKSLR